MGAFPFCAPVFPGFPGRFDVAVARSMVEGVPTTTAGIAISGEIVVPRVGKMGMHPPWLARDNGFDSVIGMHVEHARVVEVANTVLSDDALAVLDLGCGNGALLRKLHDHNATIAPFGIDNNATAIAHSAELLPDFPGNCVVGDMFEDDRIWAEGKRYSLALLMPGRLVEHVGDKANRLRERLATQCEEILVYAYGDWIERYGTLKNLAEAARLTLKDANANATAALAEVQRVN